MPGSTALPSTPTRTPRRRLILGAAVALALVVWLAPKVPVAGAQESRPAATSAAADTPRPAAGGERRGVSINIGIDADPGPAKDDGATGAPAQDESAKGPAAPTVTDEKNPATGKRTITVVKDGKTVTVTGVPGDREFDSFDELLHNEPTLAVMIIAIVAVVFLSPVLAIALILGYRMRKARMQNETMLRLAEKGFVPPGEAIEAVATGVAPAQFRADGAAATPAERVREIRKRAAWSDLRKGVVMGAVGLALTLYSMLDDGTPNGLGLVLLFVGIGYAVLWWFEERQNVARGGG
jgi:hypothetical protein